MERRYLIEYWDYLYESVRSEFPMIPHMKSPPSNIPLPVRTTTSSASLPELLPRPRSYRHDSISQPIPWHKVSKHLLQESEAKKTYTNSIRRSEHPVAPATPLTNRLNQAAMAMGDPSLVETLRYGIFTSSEQYWDRNREARQQHPMSSVQRWADTEDWVPLADFLTQDRKYLELSVREELRNPIAEAIEKMEVKYIPSIEETVDRNGEVLVRDGVSEKEAEDREKQAKAKQAGQQTRVRWKDERGKEWEEENRIGNINQRRKRDYWKDKMAEFSDAT